MDNPYLSRYLLGPLENGLESLERIEDLEDLGSLGSLESRRSLGSKGSLYSLVKSLVGPELLPGEGSTSGFICLCCS